MGKVVTLTQKLPFTETTVEAAIAYASKVEVEGNVFTVIVERDLDTGLWTWRAFANVGQAADPTEDGSFPKLSLTLQEEPSLLYATLQEARDAARATILAFGT